MTATTSSTTSVPIERTGLRLVPRPVSEPPFDDELSREDRAEHAGRRGGAQATLALAFTVGRDVPAVPQAPVQLRLLPTTRDLGAARVGADGRPDADGRAGRELDAFCSRQSTPRAVLPDPRGWTARLTQAVIEVLAGARPLPQLAPWVTEGVYAELAPRVRAKDRRAGRAVTPTRAVLRTLRVCEPVDGVAEASAVVQYGARCRAFALRLEGLDGRWRCTTLQIV